jgi:hypothetical protein
MEKSSIPADTMTIRFATAQYLAEIPDKNEFPEGGAPSTVTESPFRFRSAAKIDVNSPLAGSLRVLSRGVVFRHRLQGWRTALGWPGWRGSLGVASHAEHRAHPHPEIASNPADARPLGAGGHDRRHLVGVGVFEPPAAEPGAFGLGPA